MTIISTKNLGNLRVLTVSQSPNGIVAAPIGSLAKLANVGTYKNVGGTSWVLLSENSPLVPSSNPNIGGSGSQGPQGYQGAQGNQGVQGSQGVQGGQGRQGPQGNQGVQGYSGHQGNQGNQGALGSQGAAGGGGGNGLILVSSQVVTGSAVSSVTFSGLNGDVDKNYAIVSFVKITAASGQKFIVFKPNGLTTNLSTTRYQAIANSHAASLLSSTLAVLTEGYNGTESSSRTDINARTGGLRHFCTNSSTYYITSASTAVNTLYRNLGIWLQSSTNITSLVIASSDGSSSIAVGSEFYLYKYEV